MISIISSDEMMVQNIYEGLNVFIRMEVLKMHLNSENNVFNMFQDIHLNEI